MTETILTAALALPWIGCTSGWLSWVTAYALVTPWRFRK